MTGKQVQFGFEHIPTTKGDLPMNILFVTSECAPFSKSGGLADVAFSLPPALKQAGDNIEIIVDRVRPLPRGAQRRDRLVHRA